MGRKWPAPCLPWFVLLLSAVVLAFNYHLFIVPNAFAPAGINGIATMVQYKAGFSIGYMSLLINVPLCILSWFLTDRRFSLRTLFFCLVYSVTYLLLQKADLDRFRYNADGVDTIFPCLIAGILSGAIYGICFRLNGSTGGTDLISRYISKRDPRLNFFWVTFTLNAVVAAASFFVYAESGNGETVYHYKPVCLCLVYCFISSYTGSAIISGTRQAYHVTIITEHPSEIEEAIIKRLKHTATLVHAEGAYSRREKALLSCIINRNQLIELKEILAGYDDTFSYIETVNETAGNFKRIRSRQI